MVRSDEGSKSVRYLSIIRLSLSLTWTTTSESPQEDIEHIPEQSERSILGNITCLECNDRQYEKTQDDDIAQQNQGIFTISLPTHFQLPLENFQLSVLVCLYPNLAFMNSIFVGRRNHAMNLISR